MGLVLAVRRPVANRGATATNWRAHLAVLRLRVELGFRRGLAFGSGGRGKLDIGELAEVRGVKGCARGGWGRGLGTLLDGRALGDGLALAVGALDVWEEVRNEVRCEGFGRTRVLEEDQETELGCVCGKADEQDSIAPDDKR